MVGRGNKTTLGGLVSGPGATLGKRGKGMGIRIRAALVGGFLMMTAGAASAGPIQNACLQAGRQGANPALCGCIQQVADITLQGSDQRRAAGFFKNPDKAQDTRMSQTRTDDAFWERYKLFGQQAEMACSG